MEKQNIMLSVCMTTFNMEKYIERSLKSVLMQKTDFSFEVIIADDCSRDKTRKIIQNIKNQSLAPITLLLSNQNNGVVENCFKTISRAQGKYIAFLDADDYWVNENKLQLQVDILESNLDVDFVYTNFMYISSRGEIGGYGIAKDFVPPIKYEYETYLLQPYICPSSICFKRSLLNLELYKSYVEMKFTSQDYPLFLDFTKRGNGWYLSDCTLHYTVREDSQSRQTNLENKINYFYNCYEIGSWFIKENPISNKLEATRTFSFRLKVLLASWSSLDFDYVKKYSTDLKIRDFLKHNFKASYIFIASKNKLLYNLLKPWVLRKRPPGQ